MSWKSHFFKKFSEKACKKFCFNHYRKVYIYVEWLIEDQHDSEEITSHTLWEVYFNSNWRRKEALLASLQRVATEKCFEKHPRLKMYYEHEMAEDTQLKEKFNDALAVEEELRAWKKLRPDQRREKIREDAKVYITQYQRPILSNRQPRLTRSQLKHFLTKAEVITMLQHFDKIDPGRYWESFKNKLDAARQEESNKKQMRPDKQPNWLYVCMKAAAAITIIFSGVYYYSVNPRSLPVNRQVSTISTIKEKGPELIFQNDTVIELDSIRDGVPIVSGFPFMKKGSTLAYVPLLANALEQRPGINILSIPPGRQYHITLADGSEINLNGSSRLHFPVNFSKNERWIEMEGEAFFHVNANKAKPFFVRLNDSVVVTVLGTSFNIEAYKNRDYIRTSLIQGSLRMTATNTRKTILLRPGQQAHFANGIFMINESLNVDQVQAWRNGWFNFEKRSIYQLMEEIGQWYNMKVKYTKDMPDKTYKGSFSRSLSLDEIIENVSSAFKIKIEVKADTLIVSPL